MGSAAVTTSSQARSARVGARASFVPHTAGAGRFADEVARGVARGGRAGRVIRAAGAGPDHPVHPFLPESAYLKTLVLELD